MSEAQVRSGDCYEAALRTAHDLYLNGVQSAESIHVCHGDVTGTGGDVLGVRYGHGWVEVNDVVFDFSNGSRAVARRDLYYQVGSIVDSEVTRYVITDAAFLAVRSGHSGPWGPEDRLSLDSRNRTRRG